MKKVTSVLAIDRGTKYIGLAYANHKTQFIMPVGYLLNDKMVYFNIADIIQRHHVTTIVIGRPAKQKDIQEKISKFMQGLSYTIESNKVNIDTIEEDYTSIESGEILSNFKKNVGEDTVSAMKILERRFDKQKNLDIKV